MTYVSETSTAPPPAATDSAPWPAAPLTAGLGGRRVRARLLAGFLRRWNPPPPDDPAGAHRPPVTNALFLGGIFPPSEEVTGLSLSTSSTSRRE